MDFALKLKKVIAELENGKVSILVLMDFALKQRKRKPY